MLGALSAAGLPARAGSLVTTPWIMLKGRPGGGLTGLPAPVLDLETAALAELAGAAGLPFLGLRGITDAAGEELPDFLCPADGDLGTVGALDALGWLAADPRRIRDLFHLWRRSRLAAERLAAALLILLPLLEA